jgi:hypothetical protein
MLVGHLELKNEKTRPMCVYDAHRFGILKKIVIRTRFLGRQNPCGYGTHLKYCTYPHDPLGWQVSLCSVVKKLKKIGFVQSKIDECVFYRGQVMYVLYTDDSILAGPDKKELDKVVKDMKKAKLDITVEGNLADFLGINITREKDGTLHLSQPHLIKQIMEQL